MFAGQTATYYVDGEREIREWTPQHPGNGDFFFFLELCSLMGFIMGPTTMVLNLVRPVLPLIKSVLYCFLSHPEMKFLDNVTYLYT